MESNNIAKTARGIETGGGGERDACLVVTEMRQRQIGEREKQLGHGLDAAACRTNSRPLSRNRNVVAGVSWARAMEGNSETQEPGARAFVRSSRHRRREEQEQSWRREG